MLALGLPANTQALKQSDFYGSVLIWFAYFTLRIIVTTFDFCKHFTSW